MVAGVRPGSAWPDTVHLQQGKITDSPRRPRASQAEQKYKLLQRKVKGQRARLLHTRGEKLGSAVDGGGGGVCMCVYEGKSYLQWSFSSGQ